MGKAWILQVAVWAVAQYSPSTYYLCDLQQLSLSNFQFSVSKVGEYNGYINRHVHRGP